jgi:exoribonuclease R
MKRYR